MSILVPLVSTLCSNSLEYIWLDSMRGIYERVAYIEDRLVGVLG